MIQTVQYESCTRLSCAGCLPAEVVLCLDEEIVASGHSFIEATLTQACKTYGPCNSTKWKYVFEYDTDLLIDSRVLVPSDIGGVFCKGCLTNWVESLVSELASDSFTTITVPYGDDIIADSPNDTLNFLAGDCVYLESDAETDSIIISIDPDCIGSGTGGCCTERLYTEVSETGDSTVGTAETNLMSYTLPADTIEGETDSVHFSMAGVTENVGTTTFRVYFGTELLATFALPGGGEGSLNHTWEIWGEIVRVSANSYVSVTRFSSMESLGYYQAIGGLEVSSGSINWAASQLIKLTGDESLGSTTQHSFFVDRIDIA